MHTLLVEGQGVTFTNSCHGHLLRCCYFNNTRINKYVASVIYFLFQNILCVKEKPCYRNRNQMIVWSSRKIIARSVANHRNKKRLNSSFCKGFNHTVNQRSASASKVHSVIRCRVRKHRALSYAKSKGPHLNKLCRYIRQRT